MLRTTFLIDGFNVYHSLRQASKDLQLGKAGTRWLNLSSLLQSYLPNIHTGVGSRVQLEEILYFSALPNHLGESKMLHHATYVRCLESTGIRAEMGRFKKKSIWCSACHVSTPHWEEKETDVAIAVHLTELALRDQCDIAVLVTGDTDMAPAVRMVRRLAPHLKIVFAFPYKRKNNELEKLADFSFNLSKEAYARHQFPASLVLPGSREITKTSGW